MRFRVQTRLTGELAITTAIQCLLHDQRAYQVVSRSILVPLIHCKPLHFLQQASNRDRPCLASCHSPNINKSCPLVQGPSAITDSLVATEEQRLPSLQQLVGFSVQEVLPPIRQFQIRAAWRHQVDFSVGSRKPVLGYLDLPRLEQLRQHNLAQLVASSGVQRAISKHNKAPVVVVCLEVLRIRNSSNNLSS